MSRDIVQQLNQLIGILSLSRTRNSLLMWSHYADQYAGAVVAFDGSHDFFSGQIDIEYRPTRPRRHVQSYLAGTPIPVAELCAKSDQWAYEREVRVIRSLALRDVEDLLAERGVAVSYETVRRWVNHFGPMIAADLRKRRLKPHTTWHLDEVYLKIDAVHITCQ